MAQGLDTLFDNVYLKVLVFANQIGQCHRGSQLDNYTRFRTTWRVSCHTDWQQIIRVHFSVAPFQGPRSQCFYDTHADQGITARSIWLLGAPERV